VDNTVFAFAMALTTYVGRLAPTNEKTMTLSMGVAVNHRNSYNAACWWNSLENI